MLTELNRKDEILKLINNKTLYQCNKFIDPVTGGKANVQTLFINMAHHNKRGTANSE